MASTAQREEADQGAVAQLDGDVPDVHGRRHRLHASILLDVGTAQADLDAVAATAASSTMVTGSSTGGPLTRSAPRKARPC